MDSMWIISVLSIFALEWGIAINTYFYFVVVSLDTAATVNSAEAGGVVLSQMKKLRTMASGISASSRTAGRSMQRERKASSSTVQWSIMDVTHY